MYQTPSPLIQKLLNAFHVAKRSLRWNSLFFLSFFFSVPSECPAARSLPLFFFQRPILRFLDSLNRTPSNALLPAVYIYTKKKIHKASTIFFSGTFWLRTLGWFLMVDESESSLIYLSVRTGLGLWWNAMQNVSIFFLRLTYDIILAQYGGRHSEKKKYTDYLLFTYLWGDGGGYRDSSIYL